jgi:hypothetical protein
MVKDDDMIFDDDAPSGCHAHGSEPHRTQVEIALRCATT